MPLHRPLSQIQADLAAAYDKRSELIRAGAQQVATPASGSTQFLTLDQVQAMIDRLASELAAAEADQSGCAQAAGFGVIQVVGGRHRG